MNADEIGSLIRSAISEVQSLSGRNSDLPALSATPIGDVEGFDSLCSIETTVLIEKRLGIELGVDSIFISTDGKRALTIEQACTQIQSLMAKNGGRK